VLATRETESDAKRQKGGNRAQKLPGKLLRVSSRNLVRGKSRTTTVHSYPPSLVAPRLRGKHGTSSASSATPRLGVPAPGLLNYLRRHSPATTTPLALYSTSVLLFNSASPPPHLHPFRQPRVSSRIFPSTFVSAPASKVANVDTGKYPPFAHAPAAPAPIPGGGGAALAKPVGSPTPLKPPPPGAGVSP